MLNTEYQGSFTGLTRLDAKLRTKAGLVPVIIEAGSSAWRNLLDVG